MSIDAWFWQLCTARGDEWREASQALWNMGYAWEWICRSDGTEEFVLKDREEWEE